MNWWFSRIGWSTRWVRSYSLPSLVVCIMIICVSCTIAVLCCSSWKFYRTYSLMNFGCIESLSSRNRKQHVYHTWRETILFEICLGAHSAFQTDYCGLTRSMGILETVCSISVHSVIGFLLWFLFRDRSDLEKNTPRIIFLKSCFYLMFQTKQQLEVNSILKC